MTLRSKQYLTQGDFSKKDRKPSDHLKMPECLYDRVFLFLRRLRRRHIHLVHIDLHADVILCLGKFGQKAYRLHMARYLLIDVRFCARSRKHILSKRKQVHASDIAHSQMQTDAICGKIDIHITVLTIEVYYHIFKTCFAFALTNWIIGPEMITVISVHTPNFPPNKTPVTTAKISNAIRTNLICQ